MVDPDVGRKSLTIGPTPLSGRPVMLCLLLVLTLVIASCESAEQGESTTTVPELSSADVSEETTDESADTTTIADNNAAGDGQIPVRYTQAGTSMTFANLLYAISSGYFEDENLAMEYLPFPPSSADVLTMVVTGEADVSFSAPSAFYGAVSQGRPVTQYATSQKGPMIGLGLRNDIVEALAAQGVTPDSPIEQRVAAIEGLSIASVGAGSSTFAAFQASLAAGGLTPSDITSLPVPGHGEAVTAAREGQADGFVAASPALFIPETEGWGALWYMYPEVPQIGDLPWAEFVANDDFVNANREVVPAMLRALWRTVDDFKTRPEHVKEVLKSNWYEDTDEALFDAVFELAVPVFSQDLFPDEDGFERSLNLYNDVAEVPVHLTFEDAYDTGPIEETAP